MSVFYASVKSTDLVKPAPPEDVFPDGKILIDKVPAE